MFVWARASFARSCRCRARTSFYVINSSIDPQISSLAPCFYFYYHWSPSSELIDFISEDISEALNNKRVLLFFLDVLDGFEKRGMIYS